MAENVSIEINEQPTEESQDGAHSKIWNVYGDNQQIQTGDHCTQSHHIHYHIHLPPRIDVNELVKLLTAAITSSGNRIEIVTYANPKCDC